MRTSMKWANFEVHMEKAMFLFFEKSFAVEAKVFQLVEQMLAIGKKIARSAVCINEGGCISRHHNSRSD